MIDKTVERKILIKRFFPRSQLFKMGKALDLPYFRELQSAWEIDTDTAALEIASSLNDDQLGEAFTHYQPRKWEVFRGQHYSIENGEFRQEGSHEAIQIAVAQIAKKHGQAGVDVLKCLVQSASGCSLKEINQKLPESGDASFVLPDLEKLGVTITSYKGKELQEWKILEETVPMVRMELGLAPKVIPKGATVVIGAPEKREPIQVESALIERMDRELDWYLNDLVKHRLNNVIEFGKSFSVSQLATYLRELFGPLLYFDSLLSITQQYGLADVEIVYDQGRTGKQTGWNLSLFGEPGTGKSFSCRDVILGKPGSKVSAHGVPGRNRYAGGMTPARFIRIGQAYSGRVFNFIVPEFNDWFKYKGMVEPLKLAMERGEIKYETHREVIGPYRLSSFFSVNYNVAALGRGYEVTVQDPNFNAIEDRMLCRLHRLTKQRYVEIAESQMRLAFGEIDVEEGAQQIRDHLALVYAAETQHPIVKQRLPSKPVMLIPEAQEMLIKTRKAILEEIPRETVSFSARLEDHAISFACAASLLDYFQSSLDYIPVNKEALKYAIRLYVEEASVRSREEFRPETALARLSID